MENWKQLCYKIRNTKYRNEASFEEHFTDYLDFIFGWRGRDLGQQIDMQLGHHHMRLDLVLNFDNEPTIVLELKKPGVPLDNECTAQLSSYMKHLGTEFGILTNASILQLYYRPRNSRDDPDNVLTLRFNDENNDGIRLGELLSRQSYSEEALRKFCEEKQRDKQTGKNVETLVDILLSSAGKNLLFKALQDSNADGGYSDDVRKQALAKIAICRQGVDNYNQLPQTIPLQGSQKPVEAPQDHGGSISNRTYKHVPNRLIEAQMSHDLDQKILAMIPIYKQWLQDNDKERDFVYGRASAVEWVQNNVLNTQKLRLLSNEQYEQLFHEIPRHLLNLNEGANRTMYSNLQGNRQTFIRAIEHLNETPAERRFEVIEDYIGNDEAYKIKGLAQSFWSEIIRCRFLDVPLVNSKTEEFFAAIGLDIGASQTEKLENVHYCYTRWGALYPNDISMNDFSHMEHFAKVAPSGKEYMRSVFHKQVGEK